MKTKTVMLCAGAAGVQGSAIVNRLLEAGYLVKTVARNEERCEQLRTRGIDASLGSFDDLDSLLSASKGADSVIFLPPLGSAEYHLLVTKIVIEMSQSTNVEHIVYKGGRHPDTTTGVESFDAKHSVETQLVESGIPFTDIRSTIYMENFAAPWSTADVNEHAVLKYPVAPDVEVAWNSIDDVAQFVVAALNKPELAGRSFDIGGPQSVTGDQIARQFSSALGREISYEYIPREKFAENISAYIGEEAASSVCDYYQVVESYPEAWGGLDDDIKKLDYTPQDTFESWVKARKPAIFC